MHGMNFAREWEGSGTTPLPAVLFQGGSMRTGLRVVLAGVLAVALSYSAWGQAGSAAVQAQPAGQQEGISRQQADEILQELRQIRQLLQRGASPQATAPAAGPPAQLQKGEVNIAGLSVLGRKDAPLTMVEFSDFQCPFCRAFHSAAFEQIKREWIDTGKLRFVSWDLPLEFHSNAANASRAARCAGEQDRFWELRTLLIANASKLEPDAIAGYAKQVPGFDVARFQSCFNSGKYAEEIKKAVADANVQGISGTPTFLIAKTRADVVDGIIMVGAQPYTAFDAQLKKQYGK
jgi:protein-disulfide isomerase